MKANPKYFKRNMKPEYYHSSKLHKRNGKTSVGPGGIECNCCQPLAGNNHAMKRYTHRFDRRTAQREIANELQSLENKLA